MKHRLLFAATAILAIVSCSRNEIIEDKSQGAPDITASIINDSPNVKTSISVDQDGVGTIWWLPKDKVNIFFDNTSIPYTSTNTEPATTVVFTTTAMIGSTESASTNRWGLYPYDENASCDGRSVTTTIPSLQYAVPETFDNGSFTMLGHSSDNKMTFYNVCGGIKFSLSRDDIQKIIFKGNNNEDITGKVKLKMDANGRPEATVVEGQKNIILLPKNGTTFASNTNYYIVTLPVSMTNGFTMTFETETQVGMFNYTAKAVTISRSKFGRKASIDNYATFVDKSPSTETLSAVNMGFSVRWASCNLGASKPEEYGNYYAWGEIEPKERYTWSTYRWCRNGDEESLTKYNEDDERNTLLLEDDAAYVTLGGNWRMPTESEFQELIDNCDVYEDNINGEKGVRFISHITGNSIFLPYGGYKSAELTRGNNERGYYWSSSLASFDYPEDAMELDIFPAETIDDERAYGYPIRPVCSVVKVENVTINITSICMFVGYEFQLEANVLPETADFKDVIWSSSNESIATVSENGLVSAKAKGEAIITATSLESNISANCKVEVLDNPPEAEYIDMGLSVKWATCNLGASKPEEYGGYFQWGGLEDVTSTSNLGWDNCPYHTGSSYSSGWTKYVPSSRSSYWAGVGDPDDKTVLDSEDDVAHEILGGKWRMPTDEEFTELINNCTWSWISEPEGYMVTSNISGYNKQFIFLPAAGERIDDDFSDVGARGMYWSSSLVTNYPYSAYYIYFYSNHVQRHTNGREYGRSVRPVYDDKTINVLSVSLNNSRLDLNTNETITLVATVSPSNATNKSVIWSSDNTSVATVDDSGVVIAKSVGTANIKVETVDGGFTASCSITVKPLNLSLNGTANCYIVSQGGTYKIKATKGNSDTSVGEVKGVKVLWESFGTDVTPSVGDLIKPDVSYADGYITFSTNDTYKEGNAVIAAYSDANCTEGNVLWSWHIWLTDVPEEQVYYNNAGTMMDRNLGATSAEPGDNAAIGLYYQWGRKDPFLGAANIQSSETAEASTVLPNPVESGPTTGTIDYSVKYPTTFLTYSSSSGSRNFDWLYSTSTYADETRWQIDKTIYDPCPYGWKVPKGSMWSTALNTTSYTNDGPWDSENFGMNFTQKLGRASDIWYPAADCINYTGFLYNSYRSGYYWSSASVDTYSARYFVFNESNAYYHPYGMSVKSLGYSVRCQKIQ